MKRGEVTAFLSLIFVLIVSFITAMLEAAVLQTTGNLKRLDVDKALFSVFGEYQKDLLERYDIFAVDGSYGIGEFKEENIIARLRYYGTGNMEHHITGIQYLTDESGIGFREQAVSYMENRYGLDIISEITGTTGKWEELKLKGEETRKEETRLTDDIEKALKMREEPPADEENPFTELEKVKPSRILSAVLPPDFKISGNSIDIAGLPGGRKLREGRGTFKNRADLYSTKSKLLFREFLLEKFGNALSPLSKDGDTLNYEMEYMIGEKASDAENLEVVAEKLLLLRLGSNMIFLQTDAEKQAKAEALSLTVCTLLCIPEAKEAVKQLLLCLWAYKESLTDLAALFSGKKLSPIKKQEEWQTSLPDIFLPEVSFNPDLPEGESGYEDFLRILLLLKKEETLTMKALDCVEQKLRFKDGLTAFRLDNAMIKLQVENEAEIGMGLTYRFPGSYRYI